MIIMVNGAFGVGKTTTTELLAARLPNSMIYDPEEVGYMLWKVTTGVEVRGDFQDLPLWRTLSILVAEQLRKQYQRTLIVPMTLAHSPYFQEIKSGLAKFDPDLYHFCLTASVATIHERLAKRGDAEGAWSFQQTARCVQAFQSSEFQEQIDTEQNNPAAIVNIILSRVRSA